MAQLNTLHRSLNNGYKNVYKKLYFIIKNFVQLFHVKYFIEKICNAFLLEIQLKSALDINALQHSVSLKRKGCLSDWVDGFLSSNRLNAASLFKFLHSISVTTSAAGSQSRTSQWAKQAVMYDLSYHTGSYLNLYVRYSKRYVEVNLL